MILRLAAVVFALKSENYPDVELCCTSSGGYLSSNEDIGEEKEKWRVVIRQCVPNHQALREKVIRKLKVLFHLQFIPYPDASLLFSLPIPEETMKMSSPIACEEVGNRLIEGPELIEITNEKVAVAKEKLKEARSRQKSYADKHRRDLEFQVGDRVFLKVSPFRGVKRFGIKGKLSPRFIGPFEILERIGEVSYRLALPPQLSHVHDVFHVSLLRGYHYHPLHVASYPFDQIQPDMSLSEEPESILDRQERVMRNKVIPFVKILWKNHPEREATWETEESMRASYPHFFV
ncbi:putative nucleotidyltransferase, ribonuclease H [Tanacetum coccineum]